MVKLNDIVQLQLNYTCKVIVGTDHDKFLARLLEVGEVYLENNKIFTMFFDVTPLSEIGTVRDYGEIVKHFPSSNRVLAKAFYVGNYSEEDQMIIINEVLKGNLIKYDIVEFIK